MIGLKKINMFILGVSLTFGLYFLNASAMEKRANIITKSDCDIDTDSDTELEENDIYEFSMYDKINFCRQAVENLKNEIKRLKELPKEEVKENKIKQLEEEKNKYLEEIEIIKSHPLYTEDRDLNWQKPQKFKIHPLKTRRIHKYSFNDKHEYFSITIYKQKVEELTNEIKKLKNSSKEETEKIKQLKEKKNKYLEAIESIKNDLNYSYYKNLGLEDSQEFEKDRTKINQLYNIDIYDDAKIYEKIISLRKKNKEIINQIEKLKSDGNTSNKIFDEKLDCNFELIELLKRHPLYSYDQELKWQIFDELENYHYQLKKIFLDYAGADNNDVTKIYRRMIFFREKVIYLSNEIKKLKELPKTQQNIYKIRRFKKQKINYLQSIEIIKKHSLYGIHNDLRLQIEQKAYERNLKNRNSKDKDEDIFDMVKEKKLSII